jgi:hypothetical protein
VADAGHVTLADPNVSISADGQPRLVPRGRPRVLGATGLLLLVPLRKEDLLSVKTALGVPVGVIDNLVHISLRHPLFQVIKLLLIRTPQGSKPMEFAKNTSYSSAGQYRIPDAMPLCPAQEDFCWMNPIARVTAEDFTRLWTLQKRRRGKP